ncbi:hypothetical protein BC936DRAFT_136734 [Jimgerdemannia flammicorona]|uniref:Uncharacterized protein n=1 Tax=Jimgerdemannia flammicorona TaxID=994334 RepID=A0A433CYY7_9FUNG|nr:hypothetical protein BC936DRAFT_136734 [Jimgerdemannia flammicorona]
MSRRTHISWYRILSSVNQTGRQRRHDGQTDKPFCGFRITFKLLPVGEVSRGDLSATQKGYPISRRVPSQEPADLQI